MSAVGVRRAKAALSSGCEPHPATAPAGSNRSSHGGNEVAEAFDYPPAPANQCCAWRFYPQQCQKCPSMADIRGLEVGLQTPNLPASGGKEPIVSGEYLKYFRFRDTASGGQVRSTLHGRSNDHILGSNPFRSANRAK